MAKYGFAIVLMAMLCLEACKTDGVPPGGVATSRPIKSTAPATPLSATPRPTTVPLVSVAPAKPAALLQKPVTPFTEVSGILRVDAAYMVSKTKARIISDQGASVVAVGPAELITENGGAIIANNAGSLVGQIRGGELVSRVRYQLAQSGDVTLPVGTILPAAGVAVLARSMRTGQLLPIGTDAEGKPVFAIASNASGQYTLYLPEEEHGNVLLLALVPATTDERLAYSLVTPVKEQAGRVIDEDTSLVTAYISRVITSQTMIMFAGDVEAYLKNVARLGAATPEVHAVLSKQVREIRREADAVGLEKATPAEVYAIAQRYTAIVLGHIDLAKIEITAETYPAWAGFPPAPALERLVNQLQTLREGTRVKLAENPDYFVNKAFLNEANYCLAPADRYVIQKPTDLGDFFTRTYLTDLDPARFLQMERVWGQVVNHLDPNRPAPNVELFGAVNATFREGLLALITNRDKVKDEVFELIRGFKPGQLALPGETLPTPPPSPCPTASPIPSAAP